MRRLKRWLLPLFTLLLVIAGAAMPWAAARFQDQYGIAAREVLPLDSVSLTLRKESEIGAILRLMGNIYDETEWPGKTRLTEDEACQAAFDALTQLDQAGLIESGYLGQYGYVEPGILDQLKEAQGTSATPVLLITEDGSSAIIWFCYWKGYTAPSYELLVDDTTGLAVAGYIPCPNVPDRETFYTRMERWLTFFRDYYGIEINDLQETVYDSGAEFTYLFDPEDGLGTCGLSTRMYTFEMDFGPCSQE